MKTDSGKPKGLAQNIFALLFQLINVVWLLSLKILKLLKRLLWQIFLRPSSKINAPRWLIISIRLILALVIILFLLYPVFFSVKSSKQVMRAFGYRFTYVFKNELILAPLWKDHDIEGLIKEASQKYSVEPELIDAIIHTESNYRHTAISRTGACGLMQIMPFNIEVLEGGNPFEPRENIMMGTRFLSDLSRKFNGVRRHFTAAYYSGGFRVNQALKNTGEIPKAKDVRNYVQRVEKYYQENIKKTAAKDNKIESVNEDQ